jgi:transglutaminase-like putative cysteine protease
MLPQAHEWFREIAEGTPGSLQTLAIMRQMILAPDPILDQAVTDILSQPATENLSPYALAKSIFEWVRSHMLYTPDVNNGVVIEELRTPGYTLFEISRLGAAIGDCDDYVILLCGFYNRLGYQTKMVAISRYEDQLLDHVYCQVQIDGEWVNADGIVDFPFGWEVPAHEVTNRVEYPV